METLKAQLKNQHASAANTHMVSRERYDQVDAQAVNQAGLSPDVMMRRYGDMTHVPKGHVSLKVFETSETFSVEVGVDTMANINILDYEDIPVHLRDLVSDTRPMVTDTTKRSSRAFGTIGAWKLGFVFDTLPDEQVAVFANWLVMKNSLHKGRPVVGTKTLKLLQANVCFGDTQQAGSLSYRQYVIHAEGQQKANGQYKCYTDPLYDSSHAKSSSSTMNGVNPKQQDNPSPITGILMER